MGSSQSTSSSRAAKFSGNGNRRSVREVKSAPADVSRRRTASVRNTNRSVKEFSKFWSDAGQVNRSRSSTSRPSVKRGSSNGSVRRSRTQSVDVRRTSNCLPLPNNREPPRNRAHGGSIRGASASPSPSLNTYTSSPNSTMGRERRVRSRHGSTCDSAPQSAKSEIYSPEFNQAAIAAARLKRLSLTPYTADQLSPHHHARNSFQRSYQQSPETAIY